MGREREDRRVRRTHRLLHEALRALILEKGYEKVTVQHVLDRADIGRATFYAHFRDKDDLLMSGFEEMRQSLRQHLAAFAGTHEDQLGEGLEFTRALFDHAAGHRREYRALVGRRGGGVILTFARRELTSLVGERLEEVVARRRVKPVVPVEVIVHYVVSALLALLTWWLDNNLPYTAEQMGRMFDRLTKPAVHAALGISG